MLPLVLLTIADDDDRAYLTSLYNRYYRLMQKIALGFDKSNGEDIVQDAVVRLIPHTAKLRKMDPEAVAAYVALTVKTAGLDWCRRYKAEGTNFYEGNNERLLAFLQDSSSDPLPKLFAKMEYQHLGELMKRLKARERDLLMFKYYLGLTDREIARKFGVKPDSVRKMVERARNSLIRLAKEDQLQQTK